MSSPEVIEDAVCLGCGCTCDDIQLTVEHQRIVEARRACPLGVAWFGDGTAPAAAMRDGRPCPPDEALDALATALLGAQSPLVYLAPELTCEAQREGVAVADLLGGGLDGVASNALEALLAFQRRGRASATLGEIRNRADLVLFWGVDPDHGHPRFRERYGPDAAGLYVPDGRRSRTVVAVDVGEARGPVDADVRLAVSPQEELSALMQVTAALHADAAKEAAAVETTGGGTSGTPFTLGDLGTRLRAARYVAVVADADPSSAHASTPDGGLRVEALLVLSQALNGPTRGALQLLRAGGNRAGAEAVATWQTGFPAAIEFSRGYPRYEPRFAAGARLARGEIDMALVLGAASQIRTDIAAWMARTSVGVIGPRASESALSAGVALVDTAIPGIHEGGLVMRMDDVPLAARRAIEGPPATEAIARALRERIVAMRRDARRGDTGGRPATKR